MWLAELDKLRPVIVLTRDPMGRYLSAVLAAPVTSTVRGLTTEVHIGPDDGVRVPSVANLDHTQLVDRRRLRRKVGRVRDDTMGHLCEALAAAVDCG